MRGSGRMKAKERGEGEDREDGGGGREGGREDSEGGASQLGFFSL